MGAESQAAASLQFPIRGDLVGLGAGFFHGRRIAGRGVTAVPNQGGLVGLGAGFFIGTEGRFGGPFFRKDPIHPPRNLQASFLSSSLQKFVDYLIFIISSKKRKEKSVDFFQDSEDFIPYRIESKITSGHEAFIELETMPWNWQSLYQLWRDPGASLHESGVILCPFYSSIPTWPGARLLPCRVDKRTRRWRSERHKDHRASNCCTFSREKKESGPKITTL